jgi:ankyrin repeat protein
MSLQRRRFGISGIPKVSSYGVTPEALDNAVRSGDLEQVESILRETPDLITSKDSKYRATLLHFASSFCPHPHTAVAKYLLENGAEVDAQDRWGLTPLAWAAAWGREAEVELLLAHGATLDLADGLGRTPLHLAVHGGCAGMVELLCARGADRNAKTNQGATHLICAAAGGFVRIAEILLTSSTEAYVQNCSGGTTLTAAAERGHEAKPVLPLSRGANANAKDNGGFDALYYAASNGRLEVAKLLLSHGVDVNSRSNDGWTALHTAAFGGHLETVDWLIENGAEVDATNSQHQTPLFWATTGNAESAAGMFPKTKMCKTEEAEAGNEAAPKNNDKAKVVKFLLARGADINVVDELGRTPLFCATNANDLEVTKLLLDADVKVNARDGEGWTALCVAAKYGYAGIVKLLLERGADASIKVKEIYAPLNFAVLDGHREAAELLLAAGTQNRMIAGTRCPRCGSNKQVLIGAPLFVSDRQTRTILRCAVCGSIWSKRKIESSGWLGGVLAICAAGFYGYETFHDRHSITFLNVALVAVWILMGIQNFSEHSERSRIWVKGSPEAAATD